MPRFEWDASLTLGDAALDRQHKILVALINTVHEKVHGASESEARDVDIMNSLTAMYLYAKEHFFDEEACMERLGYPERASHTELHKAFVDQTHTFTDAYLNNSLRVDDVIDYLVNWFRQHIAMEDAKIIRFANAQAGVET